MKQINGLKKLQIWFRLLTFCCDYKQSFEVLCKTEVTTVSDCFQPPVSQNVHKINIYTRIYQVFNLFRRKSSLYPDNMEHKGFQDCSDIIKGKLPMLTGD